MPYPNLDPVIFNIWKIQIRWYGMMYLLGFIIAFFVMRYLAVKKNVKLAGEDLWDFIFYAMLGVIVGGRIGYCLFYAPGFYLLNPLKILALWEGGMSFHGGFIGVFIGTLYYCWKKKVLFYDVADIVVAAAPLGIGLGRIGNFINGELYGRITDVAWCTVFPEGGPVCRHPSQLYESLTEGFLLFIILFFMNVRGVRRGIPFWSFFLFYGLFRFINEFFREPDAQLGFIFGPFTMGQILSAPMVLAGGIMIGYLLMKKDDPKPRRKGAKR
ncbi:MAG: prolipoprotein diacylglyceryl transferase [Deltaproteobacteria bacterium]|nr:prolipoprotein diacylglyceryl transferase [Candidatus Zymogenaceae bacterium]